MTAEKPLTIECARCYSTAIVPILSFGRGPRGDDTVGCAACGYTWRAPEDVTAAVVEAEQAWVESQAATEDDPPLHRLRDGTTGTTLEALAEAQREVEGLEREKAALEGQVEVERGQIAIRERQVADGDVLWMAASKRAREAEQQRDALAAGLADALDALADMSGFTEAAYYAEKYGVVETMTRLRALLPTPRNP